MKAKIICILLLVFSLSVDAKTYLNSTQIQPIMKHFFEYHVEKTEMTSMILKRSLKLYIEQFDPEKIYLTEGEVLPFLQISDSKSNEILRQYQNGKFDWFVSLNELIQKAILRSRDWEGKIANEGKNIHLVTKRSVSFSFYSQDTKELYERQKEKMHQFLSYHHRKSPLDSKNKIIKAQKLFLRKKSTAENSYLFVDSNQYFVSKQLKDHYFAEKVLKAMAKSLDAHTSFFTEEEAMEMRINLEKQFEGVGVVLTEGIEGVIVSGLINNSPAKKSGKIQVHDVIVKINGVSVEEMPFEEVLNLMKVNQQIDLELKRESMRWSVSLTKTPILMDEDRLMVQQEPFGDGIIGKITLNSFYENGNGVSSERDIRKAINELKKQGPLHGIVLDLRSNAGGFLSQAVKVSGLFISSGVVVISKYGQKKIHYLRKVDTSSFYNGPLIILTSKLSASAAEIVAQALQDYGAGLIVGDERTYGKGSIQYQTVTDANAKLFFKVTIGKYYTVSGKSTQVDGVKADIVIPSVFSSYSIGERFLEYPLSPDRVDPAYQDSLKDLDYKSQKWFKKYYLPFLQKQIFFWKKLIPLLSSNSQIRRSSNVSFQAYLKGIENLADSQLGAFPSEDTLFDHQMFQATEILKDMIFIENKKANELDLK